MRGSTLEVNPEGLGGQSTLFVNHFFDPDLGIEILFNKEGTAEKGGLILKYRRRKRATSLQQAKTFSMFAILL